MGSTMRRVFLLGGVAAACAPESFFTVDDDPPRVTIVRPIDLAVFDPTGPVELCAVVEDEADDELLSITLESSRSGPLVGGFGDCEGGNYVASLDLGQFTHVVALTAVDPRGQSAAAAITLVPETNEAPFCTWGAPADGVSVAEGLPVVIEFSVGDPDGLASDLALTVRSSLQGTLVDTTPPTNGQVRATLDDLLTGTHDLAATVVDRRGYTATCGIRLTVDACVDLDRDGVTTCEGDCNDADDRVKPGLAEVPDGRDNDCNGTVDEGTVLFDDDGDGYTELQGDCDDADPARNPGETDIPYDGVDADCSGGSDYDVDGDGFDTEAIGGGDCDDDDAAISPVADEVWYDGLDQDCTGGSDYDQDGDASEALPWGDDCDDLARGVGPDVPERCYDGVDQNCNAFDEYDCDADGEDADAYGGTDCDDTNPNVGLLKSERWYDGLDQDCSGGSDYDQDLDNEDADFASGTDCDDLDAQVGVLQTETWYDGFDQDCSGTSDYDQDADGQTAAAYGGPDCDDLNRLVFLGAAEVLYDGVDADCSGGSDYDADADGHDAEVHGGDDCDDIDPGTYLGAREIWYDGIDQDCGGDSDFDRDGDGYTQTSAPDGSADDCDDGRVFVYPGAVDAPYDGIDSDCAGDSDFDADGDGQSASFFGGSDCDDTNPDIRQGVAEFWYDDVDQDCSGGSDHDQDGDGYTRTGAPDGSADDCDDTASGYAVNPGATEVWYDGRDGDCSGTSDYDQDGDGRNAVAFGGTDCNDLDRLILPGASERRNAIDDDCDGACDEGLIGSGDLVITEIMKNPQAVDDLTAEWFEVYNPTNIAIAMCSGWSVVDDDIDTFDVQTDVTIPAKGFVVFARTADTAANGGVSPRYAYGGAMDLGNSGDELTLAFLGVEIDRVAWVAGWPSTAGRSMELSRTKLDATSNNSSGSWCDGSVVFGSGDRGSPGRISDGCP